MPEAWPLGGRPPPSVSNHEVTRRDECTTSYFVDLWMAEANIPAFRLCHWDELSGMCDTATQSMTCEVERRRLGSDLRNGTAK